MPGEWFAIALSLQVAQFDKAFPETGLLRPLVQLASHTTRCYQFAVCESSIAVPLTAFQFVGVLRPGFPNEIQMLVVQMVDAVTHLWLFVFLKKLKDDLHKARLTPLGSLAAFRSTFLSGC